MIVITNPISVVNEIEIIHALFEHGLETLHIRKPEISQENMKRFLNLIDSKHHKKLILNSHYVLADHFKIKGFHLNSQKRKSLKGTIEQSSNSFYKATGLTISTSVHALDEFNSLPEDFDYAFLSPVFKSISKENYEPKTNLLEELPNRSNYKTKMVALGGIDTENINTLLQKGFDDFALLGAIWNKNNAIEKFKICRQIAHSYLQ